MALKNNKISNCISEFIILPGSEKHWVEDQNCFMDHSIKEKQTNLNQPRTSITFPVLKVLVINYREGGYKMGKSWIWNFSRPPPSRQGKTFCAPSFKEWKLFVPLPFNMAKTSTYRVKPTPKLFVPPPSLAWLKLFPPPTLYIGVKTSHAPPPSRFVAPPPPPRKVTSPKVIVGTLQHKV